MLITLIGRCFGQLSEGQTAYGADLQQRSVQERLRTSTSAGGGCFTKRAKNLGVTGIGPGSEEVGLKSDAATRLSHVQAVHNRQVTIARCLPPARHQPNLNDRKGYHTQPSMQSGATASVCRACATSSPVASICFLTFIRACCYMRKIPKDGPHNLKHWNNSQLLGTPLALVALDLRRWSSQLTRAQPVPVCPKTMPCVELSSAFQNISKASPKVLPTSHFRILVNSDFVLCRLVWKRQSWFDAA